MNDVSTFEFLLEMRQDYFVYKSSHLIAYVYGKFYVLGCSMQSLSNRLLMILFCHQRNMLMLSYPGAVIIMLQSIWLCNIFTQSLASMTFVRYIPMCMLFSRHSRYSLYFVNDSVFMVTCYVTKEIVLKLMYFETAFFSLACLLKLVVRGRKEIMSWYVYVMSRCAKY